MFERLQKPFLTIETGEAYQPVRITYEVLQPDVITNALNKLECLEQKHASNWNLFWRGECNDLHFESISSYKRNTGHQLRLGSILMKEGKLYLNLPSFKRACLLVPLLHSVLGKQVKIVTADFLNKVFGLSERLPHGFAELFDENELEHIVQQRIEDYDAIQRRCENAESAETAFNILAEYTNAESHKRLPFAERYKFSDVSTLDPDVAFLGFYIFLRGRELVAIKRWFGETGYSLANAAEETIELVFGGMNIDIIE